MLNSKLAVTLLVLVLIQCVLVDGWWLGRRKRRTPVSKCRNPRSIPHAYRNSETRVEQDESETKNEIEGKDSKRGLDKVIPVAELGLDVLKSVLDSLGSSKRKIAIGIGNDTPYDWEAVGVYFRYGTSDDHLPRDVSSKKAAIYSARKTNGPVATGAVGVLCYYIPKRRKSLCVMFSVPFNYHFFSNWWDVQVFSGKVSPNYTYYKHMYYGNPYKGDNSYHEKELCHGFVLKDGYMNSGGKARLEMKIEAK